jgi:hypothetical protein
MRVTLPGHGRRHDTTRDYIFLRNTARDARPIISPVSLAEHSAVTCDVDLSLPQPAPPPVVANVEAPILKTPADEPAPVAVSFPESAYAFLLQNWRWFAGALAGFIFFLLVVRRLTRKPKRKFIARPVFDVKANSGSGVSASTNGRIVVTLPQGAPPYVHIETVGSSRATSQTQRPGGGRLPDDVREGVIANLSHWLKQMFVRRLISDRAELIATQEAAAQKLMAVDERLTNIERQIQQRNQQYEQRIDALLKELAVAREENRELIRLKIAQVRAEMEREKLKDEQSRQQRLG